MDIKKFNCNFSSTKDTQCAENNVLVYIHKSCAKKNSHPNGMMYGAGNGQYPSSLACLVLFKILYLP